MYHVFISKNGRHWKKQASYRSFVTAYNMAEKLAVDNIGLLVRITGNYCPAELQRISDRDLQVVLLT